MRVARLMFFRLGVAANSTFGCAAMGDPANEVGGYGRLQGTDIINKPQEMSLRMESCALIAMPYLDRQPNTKE